MGRQSTECSLQMLGTQSIGVRLFRSAREKKRRACAFQRSLTSLCSSTAAPTNRLHNVMAAGLAGNLTKKMRMMLKKKVLKKY